MNKITQYMYPAVFIKGNEEIAVNFPDLNLTTSGDNFEEAFLLAKDYLRVYCTYAQKFEFDMQKPTLFDTVSRANCLNTTMLIDAIIFPDDVK